MPFAFLPIAFLLMPLLEIAVFILVGRHIGVLPTIGLVVLAAIAGALLLRIQGLATLVKARRELESGRLPGRQLADVVMIGAAGMLLVIPGFITDAIGLLLFLPVFRSLVWRFLSSQIEIVTVGGQDGRGGYKAKDIVDLAPDEFERHGTPDEKRINSPWHTGPSSRD